MIVVRKTTILMVVTITATEVALEVEIDLNTSQALAFMLEFVMLTSPPR